MTTTQDTTFESRVCSRCLGSGHYSFNMIDGTRCYGCGGRGVKYTKRGRAALDYFIALLSKRLDEFVPGDLIFDSYYGKFHEVATSERDDGSHGGPVGHDYDAKPLWRITTKDGSGWNGFPPDKMFRQGHTAEFKREAKEKALAYQATLTQAGTPRKRRA